MTDENTTGTDPRIEVLHRGTAEGLASGQEVATLAVTLPPGSPGNPPHRHVGPVFGHVVRGAMLFEVEGEPERRLEAGATFAEPGGDLIHYRDANALADAETVFVVTMLLREGDDLLTPVDETELAERAHRRASDPRA